MWQLNEHTIPKLALHVTVKSVWWGLKSQDEAAIDWLYENMYLLSAFISSGDLCLFLLFLLISESKNGKISFLVQCMKLFWAELAGLDVKCMLTDYVSSHN